MDQDDARAVADAKAVAAAAAKRLAAAALPPKPATPRTKPVTVAAAAPAPQAPLVIAQAAPQADAAPATETRDPNSLLSKTIDLKDHVVDATRKVVTAIGDIPSWLAWRMGGANGANPTSGSDARMFQS
jgi:hypothetical protein